MGEIELKTAHIDHIRPLSEYGLFRYHTAAAIAPLLSLKSREKAIALNRIFPKFHSLDF